MSSNGLPRFSSAVPPAEQVHQRQEFLLSFQENEKVYQDLFECNFPIENVAQKNCENLIGSVEVPVGIAGPLPIQTDDWQEDVWIPLATTEGALVASVNRGCKVLRESGGVIVLSERRGMTRSPVFACPDGKSALQFRDWFDAHIEDVQRVAESTSAHLKLLSYQTWIRGRYVYVRFAFDTDQAMGMNMVTIALQEALQEALQRHPEIRLLSLSSNVCTDKKDSVINSLYGRGNWVQAEVQIPKKVLQKVLKTTASSMVVVHTQKNLIGSNIAGSFSQNAHVANVLAAMYIATGQDPAHVVDGSKAFLLLEDWHGDLYASLTLPSVMVGVVGGGTTIPQQQQASLLIRNGQPINSQQLAMVVGAAALAGELSLVAALAENQLALAHQKLGRGQSDSEM